MISSGATLFLAQLSTGSSLKISAVEAWRRKNVEAWRRSGREKLRRKIRRFREKVGEPDHASSTGMEVIDFDEKLWAEYGDEKVPAHVLDLSAGDKKERAEVQMN